MFRPPSDGQQFEAIATLVFGARHLTDLRSAVICPGLFCWTCNAQRVPKFLRDTPGENGAKGDAATTDVEANPLSLRASST